MRSIPYLALTAILLAITVPLAANSAKLLAQGKAGAAKPAAAKSPAATGKSRSMNGFTPEREAAAMLFVKQHHPELEQLLAYLKMNHVKDYQRAVRDLFRTCERLAEVQEQEPQNYEHELSAWKIKSRVQLIGARLKLAPENVQLRAALRAALLEQIDLRIEMMQQERRLLAGRLEKLDSRIQRTIDNREHQADRLLNIVINNEPKVRGKPNVSPKK